MRRHWGPMLGISSGERRGSGHTFRDIVALLLHRCRGIKPVHTASKCHCNTRHSQSTYAITSLPLDPTEFRPAPPPVQCAVGGNSETVGCSWRQTVETGPQLYFAAALIPLLACTNFGKPHRYSSQDIYRNMDLEGKLN